MSEPDYTHSLHATACQQAAALRQVLVQRVLVKRGPVVYCAVIKAAYTVPDGPDCWTVETSWPEKARITVPCRNVIACMPARCSCLFASIPAAEFSASFACEKQAISDPAFSQAGVVAPPDSPDIGNYALNPGVAV